jgi:arsenate reductase-like glutaredoxin family protein
MNEIISIYDWENVNRKFDYLLLITKESCDDCKEVEEYLEKNNNKVKNYIVNKINLDNPHSEELINELEWINIEVDFVPFWSLIIDAKRIKSVKGNVKMLKEII